ncbi:MAG: hypothetical protein HFI37_02020 [Lachnospiraceae bacterium]|nr:hypothetical protein [Lachnospiraceae bacterium]
MTDRKRKNVLKRLYGRVPAMEILLLIFIVYLTAFLCITVVAIATIFVSEPLGILLFITVLCLLMMGIALYILEMIIAHFKQCKRMEVSYKALSGQEQNELFHIAASYQPKKRICFNGTYLYGNMRQLRKKCKKLAYLPNFHYVRLQEIAWIYKIEQSTVMVDTTLLTGNMMQTDTILRVHLYHGERLQGDCRYTDLNTLFELIQVQNPGCKIGYWKEWEEYFE